MIADVQKLQTQHDPVGMWYRQFGNFSSVSYQMGWGRVLGKSGLSVNLSQFLQCASIGTEKTFDIIFSEHTFRCSSVHREKNPKSIQYFLGIILGVTTWYALFNLPYQTSNPLHILLHQGSATCGTGATSDSLVPLLRFFETLTKAIMRLNVFG